MTISKYTPDKWSAAFREAAAAKDGIKLHALRTLIYEQTLKIVQQGGYTAPDGGMVKLPNPKLVRDAAVFKIETTSSYDNEPHYQTEVKVVNQDCLLAARDLWCAGLRPCVLNMASRRNPGGGVLTGAGAQERSTGSRQYRSGGCTPSRIMAASMPSSRNSSPRWEQKIYKFIFYAKYTNS